MPLDLSPDDVRLITSALDTQVRLYEKAVAERDVHPQGQPSEMRTAALAELDHAVKLLNTFRAASGIAPYVSPTLTAPPPVNNSRH